MSSTRPGRLPSRGARTAVRRGPPTFAGIANTDIRGIALDPTDPNVLLAGGATEGGSGNLYRSTNAGSNWTPVVRAESGNSRTTTLPSSETEAWRLPSGEAASCAAPITARPGRRVRRTRDLQGPRQSTPSEVLVGASAASCAASSRPHVRPAWRRSRQRQGRGDRRRSVEPPDRTRRHDERALGLHLPDHAAAYPDQIDVVLRRRLHPASIRHLVPTAEPGSRLPQTSS